MNLRSLESFYWIARLGSFRAAAAQLNSTQSTISARIRELERILVVQLFERQGRGVRLTPKGYELLHQTERLISDVTRIRQIVGNSKSLSGVIRIGVGEIAAMTWVPRLCVELGKHHPDLLIDLDIDLTINLRRKLDRGDIDIAILVGPMQANDLRVQHLVDFEMRWMAHSDLVQPGATMDNRALSHLPLMTLSRESDLYLRTMEWFREVDIVPERLHVCSSVNGMIRLVELGFAAAVLPTVLTAGLANVYELPIPSPMPVVSFYSVVRRQRTTPTIEVVEQLALAQARVELVKPLQAMPAPVTSGRGARQPSRSKRKRTAANRKR